VTVAPEVNKSTVFNKGTPHGLKVSNPFGGQTPPKTTLGVKLASKKSSKKSNKKHNF
jgi:hypothetical protein